MMKTKKMTPNQAIILLGIFLTLVGLISGIINYINTETITFAVVLFLMGLLMVYVGKRTEI